MALEGTCNKKDRSFLTAEEQDEMEKLEEQEELNAEKRCSSPKNTNKSWLWTDKIMYPSNPVSLKETWHFHQLPYILTHLKSRLSRERQNRSKPKRTRRRNLSR